MHAEDVEPLRHRDAHASEAVVVAEAAQLEGRAVERKAGGRARRQALSMGSARFQRLQNAHTWVSSTPGSIRAEEVDTRAELHGNS